MKLMDAVQSEELQREQLTIEAYRYTIAVSPEATGMRGAWYCGECCTGEASPVTQPTVEDARETAKIGVIMHHEQLHRGNGHISPAL